MSNDTLLKEWKQLKSGTDIRGVAMSEPGGEAVTLTDEAVYRMAMGFACWLNRRLTKERFTVAVGHDSRLSAGRIKKQVIAALTDAGFAVKDCGLSSTPAMFMTTVRLGCDAAVQITASHHPWQRNGLKFFTRGGGLEGSDIEAILLSAQNKEKCSANAAGEVEKISFMNDYAASLRDMICRGVNADDYERPLRGYHIVVDAGNGVGGFYAEKVLAPLGADIKGSQFLEPDGRFPNHIPNPENEAAMQSVCKATLENHADLGVIFDTDVDRAGCVDHSGNEINRNRLVALAASRSKVYHRSATATFLGHLDIINVLACSSAPQSVCQSGERFFNVLHTYTFLIFSCPPFRLPQFLLQDGLSATPLLFCG